MSRSRIIAGKAVIVIEAANMVDKTLGSVKRSMERFANATSKVGEGLFRTGFFGAIGSGLILRNFAKFDDLMLELQATYEIFGEKTREQEMMLASLEKRIRSLGKSTSYTSQEVAEAAVRLAKGGLGAEEVENSLQAILDLGRGTRTQLDQAADVYVRTMRTFQLSSADANTIVSQFVKATRKGTLDLEDLEAALKYSSGTAATLGTNLAPILAILTQISNRGLAGSIGGTSLNTAMAQLVKKMEDIQEVFPGFQATLTAGGDLDLLTTLKDLFRYTDKLTKLERVTLFQDLFNLRGSRAIASAQDIESIIRLADEIGNATNEAAKSAALMDSGFGGAIRKLVSAIDDLQLALGYAVENALVPFINGIKALVNAMNTLATINPTMAGLVVLSPGILLASGAAFLVLAKGITIATTALGGLQFVWTRLTYAIGQGLNKQMAMLAQINAFVSPTITGKGKNKSLGATPAATMFSKLANTLTKKRSMPSATTGAVGKAEMLAQEMYLQRHLSRMYQKQFEYHRRLGKISGMSQPGKNAAKFLAKSKTAALAANQARKGLTGIPGLLGKEAMSGLFKGFRGLAIGGKNLASFGRVLFTVGNTIRRFVFSVGGITTIIELLLIFGDRIPGVAQVLDRLSNAFGKFFSTLGKIGQLSSGPMALFKVAFDAFSADKGEIGMQALVAGFENLSGIIGSQLVAAVNRFKEALGPVWDFLRNVGGYLMDLVDHIISVVGGIIERIFGRLGTGLGMISDIFEKMTRGGDGKGMSIGDMAMNVVNMMAALIPQLFTWIEQLDIILHARFQEFIAHLRYAGEILDLSNIGRHEELRQQRDLRIRIANIREDRKLKESEDKLNDLLSALTDRINRSAEEEGRRAALRAESNARGLRDQSFMQADWFSMQLQKALQPVTEQAKAMAQQASMPQQGILQATKRQTMEFVTALVGSAQATRGNVLMAGKKIEQQQLDVLQDIRDDQRRGLRNDGAILQFTQ